MVVFHRLCEQKGAKPPGQTRRDVLLKEDPYMAAIAGAGDLAMRRHAMFFAGFEKRGRVVAP